MPGRAGDVDTGGMQGKNQSVQTLINITGKCVHLKEMTGETFTTTKSNGMSPIMIC